MSDLDKIDRLMMATNDPENDVPALTTLLYKVCGNNAESFDEANRLVRLFMEKAMESKDV